MSNSSETLKALVESVQLIGIRLKEVAASSERRDARTHGKMSVEVEHSAEVPVRNKDGTFTVLAQIKVWVGDPTRSRRRDPSEGSGTILSVSTTVELRYQLPRGSSFSAADLRRFATVNGVYNAWPYWRELIQNLSVRMNLPPLTLPLFRISSQN